MFATARLKLTVWYLLIIMFVSISFSIAMYTILTSELHRFERMQQVRSSFEFRQRIPHTIFFDPELLQETKNRLKIILLYINGGILGISSLAGFFLAGRTLQPIKNMVDEQNRFITDASHELRTPITSLKVEIEVALRDKKMSKDAKRILKSNLEEVTNLQSLSNSLIKLTQYQKSNGNSIFENTSLKEIVDDACKKVAIIAKHKKVSLHNTVQDISIQVNRQSLSEAFVIFLDNAIKYSPKNTSVSISSRSLNGSIVVDIKDEGIGITKQDMPHVFERFYRADISRTKTAVEGFGLGLSIAKHIVDKHNGTISVKSNVGMSISAGRQGTTFSIKIPFIHTTKIV